MPVLEDQTHERFCQLVFEGQSDVRAYMEAYGATRENAESNAWRVRDYEGVVARISQLFKRTEDKKVLTLVEKREFLKRVVTESVGNVDENSNLCQSFKKRIRRDRDGGTTEEIDYELPNKLKAIELDARLAGELNSDGPVGISVNLLLQQNFGVVA